MTTARTPLSMASSAVSVLGIIPPAMVPSVMSSRIWAAVISVKTSPSAFFTPATSVSSKRRSALSAPAIAPAAVSPLILNVSPFSPAPRGAITGIMLPLNRSIRIVASMAAGVPTKPSFGSVWVQVINWASLPESPTARPPWAPMACTIRLFTRPLRTISTTSMVAASVTLLPPTNSDWMFRRSSIALIIGPPPCTITGFAPTC